MTPLEKCPLCSAPVEQDRELEEIVREGNDAGLVRVRGDVCTSCGEAFLYPGMADRLVQAKATLRSGRIGAPVLGRVYDFR